MQHRSHYLLIALLAAALVHQAMPVAAATTAEERVKLRSAETAAKKASHLYSAKKYSEAGDAAKEAQESLAELEKSDTKSLAQPLAVLPRAFRESTIN